MNICIYGAGAIGGIMAAWLEQSGHHISIIARGAHLAAIQKNGLRIHSLAKGSTLHTQPIATADPSTLGPQHMVVITVKGPSLSEVAAGIAPLLDADTTIVAAMNGVPWWFFDQLPWAGGTRRLTRMDPHGVLRAAMPTERLVGCVIHCAAAVTAPGEITHTKGQKLFFGEPGGKNTQRTERVTDAFTQAGFHGVASPLIEQEIWIKLLGNISFNPVSALTLAPTDQMIADPLVKNYMVAVMRECMAIGKAIGIDVQIDPEARIDMARALGAFKTSMLQDMEAGKTLEIDGLLTGTLEIAEQAGVAAPFTQSLLGLIRLRASASGQYTPLA